MIRAASALLLLFSLLAGIVTVPVAPTLVCDMTGQPMRAAVQAAVPTAHKCCAGKRLADASRASQHEIERVPCCHLERMPVRDHAPVVLHGDTRLLAILAAPLSLPDTEASAFRENRAQKCRAAPRAPPNRQLPARAPPALS